MDYGMGFVTAERPKTNMERYGEMVDALVASNDEACARTFDDVKEAKTVQAVLSSIIRKGYEGVSCRREGATVFVIKGSVNE